MKYVNPILASAGVALLMSAGATDLLAGASSAAETACMMAVNDNYGGKVKNLDIVSSEFSQANSEVVINADGQRWRCLVSDDGNVQDLSVVESSSHNSGHSGSSYSGSGGNGFDLSGRTSGHCKLSNVEVGKEIYNGRCSIKQSSSKYSSKIFEITMGSAESFKFARTLDGKTWMQGPDEARFEDRGHTGIFRWSNFRLEVDQD
jgi:hypothetical protein